MKEIGGNTTEHAARGVFDSRRLHYANRAGTNECPGPCPAGDEEAPQGARSAAMRAYHATKHQRVSQPTDADHAKLAARIRERLDPGPDGCLIWRGAKGSGGYGRVRSGGRLHSPHRVMLEHKLGRTLAGTEDACHTCDNPSCANPEHLFAGSRRDNVVDAVQKGRQQPPRTVRHGTRNGAAKLNPDAVRDIRRRDAAGQPRKHIAQLYDVSEKAVRLAIERVTWAHVVAIAITVLVGGCNPFMGGRP